MGRSPRITKPGLVYHVLNRRVMRLPLFQKDDDYLAFERVLADSLDRPGAPGLLAWCLMPNHWHLVVHAGKQTNLSTWMQWMTVTHTHRRHAHNHTAGEGPLYQGRFKSFPVQKDAHFLTVCRYVEANARRAKLVKLAEAWHWSSLWVRRGGKSVLRCWVQPWPVNRPRNWLATVNRLMDEDVLQDVRQSVTRGVPLGNKAWKARVANRLGLDITLRPRGRPPKSTKKSS
ncbi:MAG: transposase [Phycisphaerae bacterium]|nr:transposase [Phycisphaerae bacterium]